MSAIGRNYCTHPMVNPIVALYRQDMNKVNTKKQFQQAAYIHGKFNTDRQSFDAINPPADDSIASVPDLAAADCKHAIDHAHGTCQAWRGTEVTHRSRTVRKWYDLIIAHKQELARTMTMESGKPLSESLAEVDYGASFVEWYA